MKTVIRDQNTGEIRWVLFTVYNGIYYWLTKEGRNKMYEFSEEQIEAYYSGDAEHEVESLKEDLVMILSGDTPKEYKTLRIAISTGLISEHTDVLTTNGNPN